MTDAFNLWDEPWIGVRDAAGVTSEVSLTQLFAQSDSYAALAGDIGTQDACVLRLLLAILMRSLDAEKSRDELQDDWSQWWANRSLPVDAVWAYRKRVHDRFDLCDPVAPFMQVGGMESISGKTSGLAKLMADVPDGASPFSMRDGAVLKPLTLPEAARWLLHCQSFDASGIKTGMKGDARVKGGKSYPIGVGLTGAMGLVIAEGNTLTETLLLNLNLNMMSDIDSVVWERPPQEPGADRAHPVPTGPADMFTWPSRRIRLVTGDEGVSDVLIANGDKVDVANQMRLEPMSAWKLKSGKKDVYVPRTHMASRQMWRGLAPLLARDPTPGPHGEVTLPLVNWLTELKQWGYLDPAHTVRLRTVGLDYKFPERSVILGMVDDSLTMAVGAVGDPQMVAVIEHAAQVADAGAVAVGDLSRDLAFVAGLYTNPSANKSLVGALRATGRERAYAALDPAFRQWITAQTAADMSKDNEATWYRTVWARLNSLGQELCREAGSRSVRGRQLSVDASFMPGEPVDTAWCWGRFQSNLAKATSDEPSITTATKKERT